MKGHAEGVPAPLSWTLTFWHKPGVKKAEAHVALFEETVLPHLDAAYNLARWLMRNDVDAQVVVQESCLRALRFFDGYRGGDAKAWLLAIVRNICHSWRSRQKGDVVPFDEAEHSEDRYGQNQEQTMAQREQIGALQLCIEMLPVEFQEVLVMRELEEMSYREIANATGLAVGTVMSRLSRARKRLEECATGTTAEAAG
jgi:RNA polymerase sigma-70 factor (ECF subfamily)